MDLSLRIARHLKTQTDELGSTLFSMTWKEHITPAGRSVFRLAVSEPLTEGSVFIGWPTPNTPSGGPNTKSTETHTGGMDLDGAVLLASWGTPAARDWKSGAASQATLDKNARPLNELVMLASWPTPQQSDMTGGGQAKRSDGRADLNDFAMLAGWPTPMAGTPARNGNNEAGNSGSSRKTVEMCRWTVDQSTDSGAGPIGYLLGPNGWEIVPASGQLSAQHSCFLMGLPAEWDRAAINAWRFAKKQKKSRE
jgi:hypothetical protein